jgi:hypothetical protein
MSKVEELEQVIEKLSPDDFARLSAWMLQRQTTLTGKGVNAPPPFRDHAGFLNSYSPEDEGLYDDAQTGKDWENRGS